MGIRIASITLVCALVAVACTPSEDTTNATQAPATTTTLDHTPVEPVDTDGFQLFVGQLTAELLMLEPQSVSELGAGHLLGRTDSELDDLSPAAQAERVAIATRGLASLDTVNVDELPDDDQITAAILRWHLEDIVALDRYRDHPYPTNYITGYHSWFPEFMADVHQINGEADADAYIDRLTAAGAQMEQLAEATERASAKGIAPTDTGQQIALWQINNVLVSATNHPLVSDLMGRLTALGTIPERTLNDYETRATQAVRNGVIPGYERLRAAVNEIEARPDSSPGVLNLPEGASWYEAALRHHLSIDLSPDEVHQLGLAQIDRLTTEITSALEDSGYDVDGLGFAGAVAEAIADGGSVVLSSDEDRSAMLATTEAHIAQSSAAFSEMFDVFPTTPVSVVRPRPGREGGSGAYYSAPPIDGSRNGLYYLSLGGSEFPLQTFHTTNFHEAIPGHHFQLAIQRESDDLPLLQRAVTFNGFAEGWGLYAERLAFEAGLYEDDPNGNIGRLRMELLRAARMVVDTGIHHLGWSRQEAIAYLTGLGFPEDRASAEVDRYIIWPGQAPAYLVGMLEILRLRDEATTTLGDRFDLAAFHTEILRHGSVPVAVLDAVVEQWVAEELVG